MIWVLWTELKEMIIIIWMFTQPQQRTTLPGITANLGKQKS
jgi:hypothetical protein